MADYTTVSIPKELGDRVEETIEGTSFTSTSDQSLSTISKNREDERLLPKNQSQRETVAEAINII